MTCLRDAVHIAAGTLAAAGVDSPEPDARALAVHVLGLERPSDLLLVKDFADDDQASRFAELVGRRARRVPLQHLTGRVGFRRIELEVGPGVFVPRPETESVVQWALDAVRVQRLAAPLLADLCAGSGAIALALAHELPGATVYAVERDPEAFAWASRNAANRVAAGDPAVRLHLGGAEQSLRHLNGRFDLVVANPPYLATTPGQRPEPEVMDHDPGAALWAGPDGLAGVRLVERVARRLLKSGGSVAVEHSDRQGRTAPALFQAAGGWTQVAEHQDLAGRDRFVTARWSPT